MKRKILCILIWVFSLHIIFYIMKFLFVRDRIHTIPEPQEILVQNDTPSPVPSSDNIPPEDTQTDISADTPAPFSAVPTVPDSACFTYEELADGTLRITGYDESKNTQNPYQVIIPSMIDGKPVTTLGTQSIQGHNLIELVISDGITTLENEVLDAYWDMYLVALPNSVIHIDEKAFYKNDYALPVAISCDSEASYAYKYAVENDHACQLVNPITKENTFLQDYATGRHTSLPYFCHIREEGDTYNYVVIEYLDIAEELQVYMNSHDYFSSSCIWDSNEFAILVLDKESGNVLQCIDSSSFQNAETINLYQLPYVDCNALLSIADWNFDGFPDICLYQGAYGTGASSFYAIFLFNEDSGLYTEADNFPSLNIYLRTDKQCIESSARGGPAEHYVYRYQYIDGIITHVATLSRYEIWEDDSRGVGVRDERLIDGEWQIYREENIILKDDFSDDAFQAAYEQLTYLYVDDGYWDF